MNKIEVLKIMQTASIHYQNFKMGETQEEQLLTLDAWYDILQDYDFQSINQGLKDYVKSGVPFPPNAGQLLPKKSSGVVPNVKETLMLLESRDNRENIATESEREKALAEMRKVLGIERRSSNE